MVRFAPLAAAFITSVVLLGTSVQPAFAQAPQYRAVPTVALAQTDSVVAGDVMWRCGPGGCTATNVTSRAAVACAQIAKKVGRLDSFSAGTEALDGAALAQCNTKAKGGDTALARAN